MLSSARKSGGSGGGPPGADSPTHRTNSANRGAYRGFVDGHGLIRGRRRHHSRMGSGTPSGTPTARAIGPTGAPCARSSRRSRRRRRKRSTPPSACGARWRGSGWDCTVATASRRATTSTSMRRSRHASRCGPDRCPTRRSISTACGAGATCRCCCCSTSPGSTAEPGTVGRTVHQQQRAAIANLTVALHDLGDRVALYAYYSQGRAAVNMVPVKRFDDHLDARVIRRLNSLEPGRVFATGGRHPPRFGRPGGSRRHVAAAAGRGVGRVGLRPRLRARLRCGRRPTRADRGAPPGDRLRVPDRREPAPTSARCRRCSAAPRTRPSPGPSNSRASSVRCSVRPSGPQRYGAGCRDRSSSCQPWQPRA